MFTTIGNHGGYTSFESHLPQQDITLISSEHVLPLTSVLDTRNVDSCRLQSKISKPATEDHTIIVDTAQNTAAQTIGMLKQ